MMMKEDRFRAMSRFVSWHWHRGDFAEQWKFLSCGGPESRGEMLRRTGFKEVRLVTFPPELGKYRVALKFYRERRFFRYLFRPSLAAREAVGFAVAKRLGIPVAEVLAFGEKRRFLRLAEAYFITRFEEGTQAFDTLIGKPECHDMLMELLRRDIARLGVLHAAGYIHGGAHPRNFLWRKNANGELESIWIDLATVRKKSRFTRRKYMLTDLTHFVEMFKLTKDELDLLMAEYRKYHDLPAAFYPRTDHERKFAVARLN